MIEKYSQYRLTCEPGLSGRRTFGQILLEHDFIQTWGKLQFIRLLFYAYASL